MTSLQYRTFSKPYDCEINLRFPADLLEDLQFKADASNANPEDIILEACAEYCERSYRQIEAERDCKTLALSRDDLRKLLGRSEAELSYMQQRLKENEKTASDSPIKGLKNLYSISEKA